MTIRGLEGASLIRWNFPRGAFGVNDKDSSESMDESDHYR